MTFGGTEESAGGSTPIPPEQTMSPTPTAAGSPVENSHNNSLDSTLLNFRTIPLTERTRTQPMYSDTDPPPLNCLDDISSPPSSPAPARGRPLVRDDALPTPARCINPASEVNARLDTQVEVRVYPCNNSNSSKKKAASSFTIRPEGCLISGNNRNRSNNVDLGSEYAMHVGRKLQRYELSDTRACQLLVTTHSKSFWVVPAPEAFSRHSGTCRLLGDRKHPSSSHTLQVGDFLRVGSVGVVVIETHDGIENRVLSEEKIQKIMKDTTSGNGGFLDLAETDGGKFIGFHNVSFNCQFSHRIPLRLFIRKFGGLFGRRR